MDNESGEEEKACDRHSGVTISWDIHVDIALHLLESVALGWQLT